jgi:hypothetical protein
MGSKDTQYFRSIQRAYKMNHIEHALKRPFPESAISWRVGATNSDKDKGIALSYIDARDVMKRLDEIFPMNWQDKYHCEGNKTFCEIGLKIDGEWQWRSDGAGDTDVEAEKGAISDAFKRAAVKWGIGQYLYSLPNEWVPIEPYGRSYKLSKAPKLPRWATPGGWDEFIAKQESIDDSVETVRQFIVAKDMQAALGAMDELTNILKDEDEEVKISTWFKFHSWERTAINEQKKINAKKG